MSNDLKYDIFCKVQESLSRMSERTATGALRAFTPKNEKKVFTMYVEAVAKGMDCEEVYSFFLAGWHEEHDPGIIFGQCTQTIEENPQLIENYKNGQTKVLEILVGKVVKERPDIAGDKIRYAITELLRAQDVPRQDEPSLV